ncbi:MAG: bifunctional (p)ppGpp synthetase/guanosine-3',5'-bis(diphosphate) 3'-pyrophosphohydrolase [Eubacteriales bacterium]|nr:bifunctional (p)ppGpp synthetase/guanosine-3',5'-bis(diphosphate) 3'-pyrophosphohydrolase [Eubacteriales bacterium]
MADVTNKYTDIGVDPILASPPDDATPQELFEILCDAVRSYHPNPDMDMLRRAYDLALEAHRDQMRKSGEPYIIHPLRVSIILAALELDMETIIAGLLHDVIEDTDYSYEEIEEMFNPDVALLVDGVTKLGKVSLKKDKVEIQADNLRKMFLAMAKDIRVILIKLADRLHNMRTLQFMKREKQIEKALETQDIYSPLAHRLGIFKIKVELDDLALRYLKPAIYFDLIHQLNERESSRHEYISSIIREVKRHVADAGLTAELYGRVKHVFSIYRKMVKQDKELDQIYDLFAIRIIVDTVADCYAVLGIIHDIYKPIPGRFKDYIAMPKPNMYSSLHTTVIGEGALPFEIQIRTKEMHKTAEYGIAAHWVYKEGRRRSKNDDDMDAKLTWLRRILEWQQDMTDNEEYMNAVKDDLNIFSENVYCFTPDGDVKTLKAGSTPVDFAYSIHSAVGNKMVGARVNGKMVPKDYQLNNGDRVEIVTSQNSHGPSLDWLNLVVTAQAKNKINQWFKSRNKEENIAKGRELVNDYAKNHGYNINDLIKNKYIDKVLKRYNLKNWEAVMAAVGHGGLKEGAVVSRLIEEYNNERRAEEMTDEKILASVNKAHAMKSLGKESSVQVKGQRDISIRLSKCCSPVPGDEIVGFITRGRGVSVHRTDCINVINMSEPDKLRLIETEWNTDGMDSSKCFIASLKIFSRDKTGLLMIITRIFSENDINISGMNVRPTKHGEAVVEIDFWVCDKSQLIKIMDKLKSIPEIMDIERVRA